MRQSTFPDESFERYRKTTKRAKFLQEMEEVVPWKRLRKVIKPHYPKPGGPGRPSIGLDRMLRLYFLQHWFDLSDPGVEEAIYESVSMRKFIGIDFGREPAPDETTICKFRHLIEKNDLGPKLFAVMSRHLEEKGIKVGTGTIVDATIIEAPSSTKNASGQRDPEMRQTKKGNQWHFGMKAHIGVDSKSTMIHSVAATAANVHDSQLLGDLLHGEEQRVYGDSAYTGQKEVIREAAPAAQDFTQKKAFRNRPLTEEDRERNRTKSRVRSLVEHPFLVLKRIFGFRKVRYRGLHKNATRLFVACGLINLYRARKRLRIAS